MLRLLVGAMIGPLRNTDRPGCGRWIVLACALAILAVVVAAVVLLVMAGD